MNKAELKHQFRAHFPDNKLLKKAATRFWIYNLNHQRLSADQIEKCEQNDQAKKEII